MEEIGISSAVSVDVTKAVPTSTDWIITIIFFACIIMLIFGLYRSIKIWRKKNEKNDSYHSFSNTLSVTE